MPTPTPGAAVLTGAAAGRLTDTRVRPGATVRHRYLPLLGPDDLTYLGAFRVPAGTWGDGDSFGYASMRLYGISYVDDAPTLWATGFRGDAATAAASLCQLSIPALADPNDVGIGGLNTATVLQGFADPADGHMTVADPNGAMQGGVLYDNALIGVYAHYYGGAQTGCCFVNTSLDLDAPSAAGPYTFTLTDPDWDTVLPLEVYGGYGAVVPPEWRAALGGPVVVGNGYRSVIQDNSNGPGLFVIDADTLCTKPPTDTLLTPIPLAYYWKAGTNSDDPLDHWSLGRWGVVDPAQTWHGAPIPTMAITDPLGRTMPAPLAPGGPTWTRPTATSFYVNGVLFADGTRSVLFWGRGGLGPYKYGPGTTDPEQDGEPAGEYFYAYDLCQQDQGGHLWPYLSYIFAVDVNEYLAVRAGTKAPWEVVPYACWTPDLYVPGTAETPHPGGARGADYGVQAGGVAWDPATRRCYIVTPEVDTVLPLVQVFQVS